MGTNLIDWNRDIISEPDWKHVYKIHAEDTIRGYLNEDKYETCNNVVYEGDIEDVIERCRQYLGKPNQTCTAFVIFKAVAIIRLPQRETETIRFDLDEV